MSNEVEREGMMPLLLYCGNAISPMDLCPDNYIIDSLSNFLFLNICWL